MKKIILSGTIAILIFATCKKEKPAVLSKETNSSVEGIQVEQKICPTTPEQSLNAINKFKGAEVIGNSNNSVSYLALDSSIWLIEAAINHDFDTPKNKEMTESKSIKFTAPYVDDKILGTDLKKLFQNMSDGVRTILGEDKKTWIIDITAVKVNNTITYEAKLASFIPSQEKMPPCFCCDYTTQTALWSYTYAQSCSSVTNDGPTMVNNKLGCLITFPACMGTFYWSNVVTTNFSNNSNAYPGTLYYKYYPPACDPVILSAGALNAYRTNCYNLAVSSMPTSPVGYQITSMTVSAALFAYPIINWWNYSVTYAVPNCI